MKTDLRRELLVLCAVCLILGLGSAGHAQTVTRGPYLQMGTPTSVVVRWRTNVASNSRVRYGPAPGSLTFIQDDAASVTNHAVQISGLTPNSTVYYSVGTSAATLAGDDANHFVLTPPTAGTAKATRIWVLGDPGTNDGNQKAVRDAYYAYTGTRHTDLWLMLGDNAYNSGTDGEFGNAVFGATNAYPAMLRKSVLWPTIGNHDAGSASSATQTGPYYDIFTMPKSAEAGGLASGTEAYYSFDYANIHFMCLNSQDVSRAVGGTMYTWAQSDLGATNQDWVIAYWHHPAYTKGSHNSDTESNLVEMRQNFLPMLETGGVDLVLAGHSHCYERSFLIDGHYGTTGTWLPSMKKNAGSGRADTADGAYTKPTLGTAPHEGAVYATAGSSGQIDGGSLNHPAMFVSLNTLGSMVLDVNANRLDAVFLSSTGASPDHFTIIKGSVVTPTPSQTPTPSRTPTPSPTASATPTRTPTPSPSTSPTASRTPTASPSVSPTASRTPTPSPSASPTPSRTPTPSPSASPTPSRTPTRTPTSSPSASPTPSRTPTSSPSVSPTASRTPTSSPSASPTPSRTPTRTPTPSPSASPTPSRTPTRTPTSSPSASPTPPRTPTTSPSTSPTVTKSPSPTPSASVTPVPSLTASPSATVTRSATPSTTPSPTGPPTTTPTASESPTDLPTASVTPISNAAYDWDRYE